MIAVELEEAIQYFQNERLFSDKWLELEDAKQRQSLKMAENQINSLKFSNYSDVNKEKNIKKAIYEQALHLIENYQRQSMINQGVSSFSVEGLSETYNTRTLNKANKDICEGAIQLLKPYMLGCVAIC